jgi:hypothetical protein
MSLKLPIAMVAIDNVAHELTRMAIEDSLRQIEPEQIIILTDAPNMVRVSGAEYHFFDGGYPAAMAALWHQVPPLLMAPHMIWLQWDSWVLDAGQWADEFLQYDYIGAPWPCGEGSVWHQLGYRPGSNVGNGGFSLRSKALAERLATEAYPLKFPEDDAICRLYRGRLEMDGFAWAPEHVAQRFSVECALVTGPTFGYHNCAHWPRILPREALAERLRAASPYALKNPALRSVMDWMAQK